MRNTKKQASMGGGKETMKRPQRGLGVAELERIRLQEEKEERRLYYASHHLMKQQQLHAADSSHQYNLQYKQVPFYSKHLLFNPNLRNPNPNCNVQSATCSSHPAFIAFTQAAVASKPPLSPSNPKLLPSMCTQILLKSSSESMLSHSSSACIPTKPSCPSSPYTEPSDFLLPYAITSPSFPTPSFAPTNLAANPNIAPFHNTNPDLKIPNVNTNTQLWLNTAPPHTTLLEHSFLPLPSSPFRAADHDIVQSSSTLINTYPATVADGGFCEAPSYHDQTSMYLAAPPNVENPPPPTDSSLNSPPSIHEPDRKKNTPALQGAEELELPSFQSMVFTKQQQSITCGYENQYMRCNFDLNNTQGEYELPCNAQINPRTKIKSCGRTSTFGGDTSPRDGFLKLGLPTLTEEWYQQGSMQTNILEHFHENNVNPRFELHYGQMVKENMRNIDLELKLCLPSFGYQ